jgi:hypothetical protein
MNFKAFFIKNWQHFAVIGFILIVAVVFFKPQLDGNKLRQHDTETWRGMSNSTDMFRGETGEEALWTNSVFGGMPATQISVQYPGNLFGTIRAMYFKAFPHVIGLLILHLIGFYILALFLKIKPIIGLIGAVAFSFASYELIIMQAGHMTKAAATAFLAPTLGAFIYAYRNNRMWGILFAALFMTYEIGANHFQVTYYFVFLLLGIGIYFFIKAMKKKELKSFGITSAGLIGGFILAALINYGNIGLTSEYAEHTVRGENDLTITAEGVPIVSKTAGLDKKDITKWSYGLGETFTFISPNVKGGGSFPLQDSQFEDIVDESDFSLNEQKELKRLPVYWGEQPMTSGPVYLGAVVVLLAFLGLVFMTSKIKWPLFAVTILAILLSWGENFMGLTDLFIDYLPGYSKFRTVTIILVIVELCVATLGIMFLSELIKDRAKIIEKKKLFTGVVAGFFGLILIVKLVGLGDNYTSNGDKKQLAGISESIRGQVTSADPAVMMSNYQLDVKNATQVDEFVVKQLEPYEANFMNLRSIRKDVFHSSMNRTLLFLLLAGGLLLLYVYTKLSTAIMSVGMLLLTMMDLIPIAYDYIGDEDKYWAQADEMNYPIASNSADEQILVSELALNPKLESKIEKARRKGEEKAESLELEGSARRNIIESHRFYALNKETNYRVFDFNGGYGSTRASYYHKSIGGFHAAKLRNIDNLISFHLGQLNEDVYNMLNVKYFIQSTENGQVAIPRKTVLGNAWFVTTIEAHKSANDEIRALGNSFNIENKGTGEFLINGTAETKKTIYGSEKLRYVLPGVDTLEVQIRAGLQVGEKASFVMDVYGATNLVPSATLEADTLNSFKELVSFEVLTEFNPESEAVMLESEAEKLSTRKFTGKGTIEMTSYAPDKIEYSAITEGKQFAVFSEIYYAGGWIATVDGKEVDILKTNYLLRGLELSGGKHKIVFTYDQPIYRTSNTMSLILSIVLMLCFVVAGYLHFKGKKSELNVVAE